MHLDRSGLSHGRASKLRVDWASFSFFFYFSAMETCLIKAVLENYLTYFKKHIFFKINKDVFFCLCLKKIYLIFFLNRKKKTQWPLVSEPCIAWVRHGAAEQFGSVISAVWTLFLQVRW